MNYREESISVRDAEALIQADKEGDVFLKIDDNLYILVTRVLPTGSVEVSEDGYDSVILTASQQNILRGTLVARYPELPHGKLPENPCSVAVLLAYDKQSVESIAIKVYSDETVAWQHGKGGAWLRIFDDGSSGWFRESFVQTDANRYGFFSLGDFTSIGKHRKGTWDQGFKEGLREAWSYVKNKHSNIIADHLEDEYGIWSN